MYVFFSISSKIRLNDVGYSHLPAVRMSFHINLCFSLKDKMTNGMITPLKKLPPNAFAAKDERGRPLKTQPLHFLATI